MHGYVRDPSQPHLLDHLFGFPSCDGGTWVPQKFSIHILILFPLHRLVCLGGGGGNIVQALFDSVVLV